MVTLSAKKYKTLPEIVEKARIQEEKHRKQLEILRKKEALRLCEVVRR